MGKGWRCALLATAAGWACALGAGELHPTAQMHTETLYMVRCLAGIHYERRPVSSLAQRDILQAYLDELDGQRLFFFLSDADEIFSRYDLTLDIFLNSGSVKPAFAIYERFRDRVNGRLDRVNALLDGEFDFSDAECYEPDRDGEDWPATEEEMEDLWRRKLEFELLNELLMAEGEGEEGQAGEDTAEEAVTVDGQEAGNGEIFHGASLEEQLRRAQETLQRRYARLRASVNDVEPTLVQELFLNSVAGLYDPHSSFLAADTVEDLQMSLTNSLVGIGAVLQDDDGYCRVVEIYPGSPAERSGQLQPGDRILAVQQGNGELLDIIGMRLNRAVKLIRGKEGTAVTLHVQPADGDPAERKMVTLVREEIPLTAQRARGKVFQVPNGENAAVPIGYIRLPAFYGANGADSGSDSYSDVKELLHKLAEADVQGLVLDLRGNSGGLLDEAISLAGLFLPGAPVVQVRDGDGRVQVFSDPSPEIVYRGPLAVLTSRQSISASEILAGALQDHGRALVIGDSTTYGKGSVQAILPIGQSFLFVKNGPQLGAARITIQKWYLPNGESIQRRGVPADIALPSIHDALPIGEEDHRHALAWDRIAPVEWDRQGVAQKISHPVTADLVERLREKSLERHGWPEWQLLEERVARFAKNVQQKQFSLEMEERQRQRREERCQRRAREEQIRILAQDSYPGEDVAIAAAERRGEWGHPGDGEEELPELDVPLRESLRVLVDWISQGEVAGP
ncbi:MAG: carboxy terminal-processing peptidase [Puniceicoccales bacterium]|jgi:carboxyl-terminal processing protease|nr:carboxy terminal-processing peptidase [Puniceicoccales bacterium]